MGYHQTPPRQHTGASIVSQVASLCGQVGVLGEEKEDLLGMTFAVGKRPSSSLGRANEKKNLKKKGDPYMQEAVVATWPGLCYKNDGE